MLAAANELNCTLHLTKSHRSRLVPFELVRSRAEGAPVAYLVGYKEFYSMTFEVQPSVLIPRPETEHLVVEVLDRAKLLAKELRPMDQEESPSHGLKMVDVGTGSGAIAIAVLKHFPRCQCTAVDIQPAALEVARRNAQRHGLDEDRLTFVEGIC